MPSHLRNAFVTGIPSLLAAALLLACPGADSPDPEPQGHTPTITGEPREGSSLSVELGGWSAPAESSLAYAWLRCDAQGEQCSPIAEAAASSLGLTAADVGQRLRARVTVSQGDSATPHTSEATPAILPLPPKNLEPPTITGDPAEGQSLSASEGAWESSAEMTVTLRWQRCDSQGFYCADLTGADGPSYLLVHADAQSMIRAVATALNAGGSTESFSAYTDPIVAAPAPVNLEPPAITGEPIVGETLAATKGSWLGVDALQLSLQWLRCGEGGCTPVDGAVGLQYVLTADDLFHRLMVRVEAKSSLASTIADSARSGAVALDRCANLLSDGPRWPTVATTSPGSLPWSQPGAAAAADGAAASVGPLAPGDLSDLLVAGFALQVPQNAQVTKVEVLLKRWSGLGAGLVEAELAIEMPDGSDYELTPSATGWGTSPETATFQLPAEQLAGDAFRPGSLNDPAFTVRLLVRNDGEAADTAFVDAIGLRIGYRVATAVGPNHPSTVVDDDSAGVVAWSSPQLAASPGDGPATLVVGPKQTTHRLLASGFGLTLPAGKQPSGVLVEVEQSGSSPAWVVRDEEVRLLSAGAPVGDDRRNLAGWETTPVVQPYGGAGDLWGLDLSRESIAASGFGVAFAAYHWGGSLDLTLKVEQIRITVFFDPVEASLEAWSSGVQARKFAHEWQTPANALTNDGQTSRAHALSGIDVSDELRLTGYGFALPAGAVVRGIELAVERSSSYEIKDRRVQLLAAEELLGWNLANGNWAESSARFGDATERWGRNWEASEINAAGFGASLSIAYDSRSGNGSAYVDGAGMTVFYCLP